MNLNYYFSQTRASIYITAQMIISLQNIFLSNYINWRTCKFLYLYGSKL